MASTTDFEEWLAACAPESTEDAFSLHDALQGSDSGIYRAGRAGERSFITRDEYTLVLASDAARTKFGELIVQYNPHPDLGWHGAEVFVKAQSKSD